MRNITTEKAYETALNDVYALMRKGENVTDNEAETIKEMALAIQGYEEIHYPFPMPATIVEMVAIKMLEKKVTQAKLAEMLNISTAKLSQILNNKRKPDVPFLKAIHEKLGVDGNFILEKV